MRWSALLLVWGVATAQEDLLKVGKTPAEKLEQETHQRETRFPIRPRLIPNFNASFAPCLKEDQPARALARMLCPRCRKSLWLPKIEYCGRHPVAMLRVDDKDMLVRQNGTLSFLSQGRPIMIQVREVNQHAVTVVL